MRFEHIEPQGSDENDGEPDDAWRDEQVTIIATDDPHLAAWPLIHLAYYYPDARWVEKYLVSIIRADGNESTRALAVTCLGHCARTHGTVDPDVVLPVLRWCLRQGQELRGRGYHAATDVTWYGGKHWGSRHWWALQVELPTYRALARLLYLRATRSGQL